LAQVLDTPPIIVAVFVVPPTVIEAVLSDALLEPLNAVNKVV
jgi:hypothetical protein